MIVGIILGGYYENIESIIRKFVHSGRKRMKIIFSVLLISIFLVNSACAYMFTNIGKDFEITYPTGWAYIEESDGTDQTFTSQTGKAWVRVVVIPSEGMTLNEIVFSRKEYLNSIDINPYGEREVTINGIAGVELTFNEYYNNRDYKELQTLILSGSNYYILTLGAQLNDFPFFSEDFDRIQNSFKLLKTGSPVKKGYVTPTPVETVKELSASVSLHREKTNVVVGEDVLLKLSVVNLITKPVMNVQIIIKPPSGMSVTSTEFSQGAAGQYSSTYKLEPGASRDIEVRLKPNEAGKFFVEGWVVYYFGDDIKSKKEEILKEPITVRLEGEITSTQKPNDGGTSDGSSTILGLIVISAIIFAGYMILKKASEKTNNVPKKNETPAGSIVEESRIQRSNLSSIGVAAGEDQERVEPVRIEPETVKESAFEAEKRKQHSILPPHDLDIDTRNYLGFGSNTAISMLDAEIAKAQSDLLQKQGEIQKDEDVLGKISKRLVNKEISDQTYNDLKNKYIRKVSESKNKVGNVDSEIAKLKKIRSFILEKGKYYA